MRLWRLCFIVWRKVTSSLLLWESLLAAYGQHVGGRALAAPCSVLPDAVCVCLSVCLCAPQIKNARTQLAQRLREIRACVRIIISGERSTAQHGTAGQDRPGPGSRPGTFTRHKGCPLPRPAC